MRPISATKRRGAIRRRPTATDFGFTLIELVVTIVLVSILAALTTMFGNPIRAGVEGQKRAELADATDTAYRRLARDVRRALPNSLIVTDSDADGTYDTIEFIPTKDGGRYQDITDGLSTGTPLNFTDSSIVNFTVLGPTTSIQQNDYVVINNWGTGSLTAYCSTTTCNNRARIAAITTVASRPTIELDSNPYPAIGDNAPSPGNRFFVIDKDEQAVSYQCVNGTLTRRWGYGFNHAAGGSSGILAQNITCNFSYVPYDTALWGLLHLQFSMSRSDLNDSAVTLVYQLHVDNTP